MAATSERWQRKDLLGIAELSRGEIELVLDTAESFAEVAARPIKKVPTLRGKTVINLFFEASTRTRSSFEIAEKRLSADNLNFSSSGSALEKGESLIDTALNLQAMAPDLIVIRHAHPGVPHLLARRLPSGVVNAGDGAHEHPTQALLDALTIRRHKGRLGGLVVAICGDVLHSRVARSNILLLSAMGARVRVVAPSTLLPVGIERLGVAVFTSMRKGLADADVVMMLRLQRERMNAAYVPSVREYFRFWGLDAEKLRYAKADAIVMHPGPMNRGVEIDPHIADGLQSVIREQVEMGVAVRMAVLEALGQSLPKVVGLVA